VKKCECGHPSSFHHEVGAGNRSKMARFADGLASSIGGDGTRSRACEGELPSGKPCPCQRYTEDV
jgi:hypothetical protein